MSTNIIVQIKVKEDIDIQMAYIIPDYPWILIPKSTCTVIETVEHVQELDQQVKDLQAKLNTYEIEESVTMKHVQPEPQRKSLGIYDGVEIFEETRSWFVDLKTLEIKAPEGFELENWVEDNINNESKVYLTPKEANARLKEEVIKKANDYLISITINQWLGNRKHFVDYAIEAFEKDHNITYLPE